MSDNRLKKVLFERSIIYLYYIIIYTCNTLSRELCTQGSRESDIKGERRDKVTPTTLTSLRSKSVRIGSTTQDRGKTKKSAKTRKKVLTRRNKPCIL